MAAAADMALAASFVDDSDDALLVEMLALLEDTPPPAESREEATAKTKTTRGIGSAARRKRALDLLRAKEVQLRGQLERLRGCARAQHHGPSAMELALAERLRRRRAEDECRALRDAVYQQMRFLRGLGSMFSAPDATLTLDLCHQLHNFMRLPRDRLARQSEYAALSRDERLNAPVRLLCHETEKISLADAHVETGFAHESDEACSATTVNVFVIGGSDVAIALRAAFVAMRDISLHSRPFQCLSSRGEIVDADALSQTNIQYRAKRVCRRSEDCEDLSIESLEVMTYKVLGDEVVILWDFVDVDELQPLPETLDVSKQSIGASLIRRETCPDGVERLVYRELSMRKYRYRGSDATPPASVRSYFNSLSSVVRQNELIYRNIMVRYIAEEEAQMAAAASV